MSELKSYKMVDEKYCTDCVCVIPSEVYLKSEADKVIAYNKYKRCLAMARWCATERDIYHLTPRFAKMKFYTKWRKRWLELAEKFKEEAK